MASAHHCTRIGIAFLTFSLLFFSGCTPLAKTAYPVAWDEGFIGTWRFEFNPALTPADAEEGPPPLLAVVKPKPDQRSREPHEPGSPAEVWPRYVVTVDSLRDDDVEPVDLVGGLIQSDKHLYFTFQQSAAQVSSTVSLLHTPLQHTFRIHREGDTAHLYFHRVILVWTPTELAGNLNLSLPAPTTQDGPRRLVQTFDDIIRYYDAAPEETWHLLGTATRAADAP